MAVCGAPNLERGFAVVVVVVAEDEEDLSTSIGAAGSKSSPGIAGTRSRIGDGLPGAKGSGWIGRQRGLEGRLQECVGRGIGSDAVVCWMWL